MALRTTVRAVSRPARPPARPTELTIEEARKQYEPGSLELAVAELKELRRLDAVTKEHANAANRQGTKAKNAIKAYAIATDMQPSDQLQIDDVAYRYDVSYSEKIDVAGLYEMLKNKEISEQEFLSSISVNKADAERTIGPIKLRNITETKPGKKLDIRTDKLDVPVPEPIIVRAGNKVKEKLKTVGMAPPVVSSKTTLKKLKPLRRIGKVR